MSRDQTLYLHLQQGLGAKSSFEILQYEAGDTEAEVSTAGREAISSSRGASTVADVVMSLEGGICSITSHEDGEEA